MNFPPSERKTAEARYRRLFETAKDGIVIVSETGDITDVNTFMVELFGYSREESLGKPYWDTPPLAGIPHARATLDRLRADEIVRFPDLTLRARDGADINIDLIGNIYLEDGKRVIQLNLRDITARKNFDRQLQQSAKLESLGILAGGVAHDFNNLLAGIMGNASLVLDHSPPGSRDGEFLREIVKASQRAADLTHQMLAYSGQGRFVIRLTGFSELIKDIGSLIKSSIPESVTLEMDLDEHLPVIAGDAIQLRQLVINLVLNAGESIPEGEPGTVRVTTCREELDEENIRLNFATEDITPGMHVCLRVTDTGTGMDETTRAKIFDPFFTTKFIGRGLGLAAALGIVKGHHGAIRVDSTPGRGTTFRVYFPAASAARPRAASPESVEDLYGVGLLLVVDGEEMVLRLATSVLAEYGYQVLTAPNGKSAVEVVRERGPELALVILDLVKPLTAGKEVLARIKAIRPDLPVILSSGHDRAVALRQFQPAELAGFIQKPYKLEELLGAVKTALQGKPVYKARVDSAAG